MENPIKMDDLGGKTTIFGNTHMHFCFPWNQETSSCNACKEWLLQGTPGGAQHVIIRGGRCFTKVVSTIFCKTTFPPILKEMIQFDKYLLEFQTGLKPATSSMSMWLVFNAAQQQIDPLGEKLGMFRLDKRLRWG